MQKTQIVVFIRNLLSPPREQNKDKVKDKTLFRLKERQTHMKTYTCQRTLH